MAASASHAAASEESDWTLLGKTRPYTLDDLRKFSSADIDPYSVQLGQKLSERFIFSPQGHRNLAFAFSALSEGKFYRDTFEIGFGSQHVVNTILKSDSGLLLTAIIGTLSEYYQQDFVVEFFKLVTKKSNVPDGSAPIDLQWSRVIDALYGLLALSPFGILLSTFEKICPVGLEEASPQTILAALDIMSDLVRTSSKAVELTVGADFVWIASAAQWLYDLKFIIQSETKDEIYRSPGIESQEDASLILRFSGSSSKAVAASTSVLESHSGKPHDRDAIHGGRVAFDSIFRLCFNEAFSQLDENLLTAYLNCAATVLQESLQGTGTDSRTVFLAQTSDIPGVLQHGLIETLAVWFPELKRLSQKTKQYKKLNYDDSRKMFDEKVKELQKGCVCALCRSDVSDTNEICQISLVEVIVSLGLNMARMVVSPRLFLKRDGVINFYKRHHALRQSRSTTTPPPTPSEEFVQTCVQTIPSPAEILSNAFLLFANCVIEVDPSVMGRTNNGLTVFLSGEGMQHDSTEAQRHLFVSIHIVLGSLSLYGHDSRLEIFDKGVTGWSFEQFWDMLKTNMAGFHQLMKWKGENMLVSFVKRDSEREIEQARRDGWLFT